MSRFEIKKTFCGNNKFLFGAGKFSQIVEFPFNNPHYKEIAFIGASNVGKSSLINALLKERVAIVSSTPGRTQQLNFFLIANSFILVDMPGYGYAKANKEKIQHWQKTSFEYFYQRKNLKQVFMLIDPIKKLKESDYEIANVFNTIGVSFQIVLTKIDKIKTEDLEKSYQEIIEKTKKWSALHPEIISTSAMKDNGISILQKRIIEILNQ
jgi:GTP-binding protein